MEQATPTPAAEMEAVCEKPDVSIAEIAPLVRRAQEGDVSAFEQLYRENVGRVYALCLRLSADSNRAEEFTQDVFIRAWEKLGSFRGESAFTSWLHRLTVNVVLSQRRSEGRRAAHEVTTDDLSYFDGEAKASLPGMGIDLERAIEMLPPGARAVFVLHDVEGYKHGEIAQLTGRAEGTCKALLHRARKLLREALER